MEELPQWVGIIIALGGGLGLQKLYVIYGDNLKRKHSDKKDRVSELEAKVSELYKENNELHAKVARLEERFLHVSRNKKKYEDN